jgi:hypothetical protein
MSGGNLDGSSQKAERTMATEQPKPDADHEARERAQRITRITGHVLGTLGKPNDLFQVQIRPLWRGYYRVNVLVGPDVVTARCAHSYFLEADGDGNVLGSTPKIARRY